MKKLATGILLATLVFVSIAAPAWADVVASPVETGVALLPFAAVGCLGLLVIAAIIVGVIFIVRHNKKKKKGE